MRRFLLLAGSIALVPVAPPIGSAQTPVANEFQKLVASDAQANDNLGSSVAISGDVAVSGAPADDDNGSLSGSAYVHRFDGTSWAEEQKLLPSDGSANDTFGFSVAASGNVAVIGARLDSHGASVTGSAYVYRFDGSSWVEEQKLLASDAQAQDLLGSSVAISGDVVVAGAIGDDDNGSSSGSAYVYRFDGSSWVEEQKLLASDGAAQDWFGISVAISGDVAVIGALRDDDAGDDSGSAHVYRFDGSSWVEEQKLVASDGAAFDGFGISVAVLGNRVVVGSQGSEGSGAAYVYGFDGTSWVEEQKLLPSDGVGGDQFGFSVAVAPNAAVIGAPADDDNGIASGSAYVYRFDGASWVEERKLLASDGPGSDQLGRSAAVSGNAILLGAPTDDNGSVNDVGSAYVFVLEPFIDIRPGRDPNVVNPWSPAFVPVAVLGSETLDVLDVNPASLAFGPSGAALAPGGPQLDDVDEDGFTDLVAWFVVQDTGILFGQTAACLDGEIDGEAFEACDDIQTFPSCGLGFELALLLPGLMWLHRRRRIGVA